MHTTDVRRARFRADATHDDDKLESCFELNCHNIRARLRKAKASAGAGASTSGRGAKRARPPADEGEGDNEDGGTEGTEDTGIAEIARGVGALGPKSKTKGKGKARAKPNVEKVAAATSTPARGRPRSRARVRVQAPRSRSGQESDGGSSKADSVKTPAVPATPAPSRRRRRSDAKPRSAASSLLAGKATTSPPSSPNARGRKPPSVSKMDSVEIMVTRSRSATRSRVHGNGAETGDEKTEGRLRKRRRVAHASTA
jgi:hypothetical protein